MPPELCLRNGRIVQACTVEEPEYHRSIAIVADNLTGQPAFLFLRVDIRIALRISLRRRNTNQACGDDQKGGNSGRSAKAA